MIAGLADGTIDAIATDHAPHAVEEKDVEFQFAPPGLIGLETALGLDARPSWFTPGIWTSRRNRKTVDGSGAMLGLRRSRRTARDRAGRPTWSCSIPRPHGTVEPTGVHSKSRNTPFPGRELSGTRPPQLLQGRVEPSPTGEYSRRRSRSMTRRARPSRTRRRNDLRGTAFGAPRHDAPARSASTRGLTGYQEVLTDPSYHGQIVTMTTPQIGNTGTNDFDDQSRRPWVAGFVDATGSGSHSSWRATESLADYLERHDVPGIAEVDTRRLTRHIRTEGAMRGALSTEITDHDELVERARQWPGLVGRDLAREVTHAGALRVEAETNWNAASRERIRRRARERAFHPLAPREHAIRPNRVAAYDFGIKHNLLDLLVASRLRGECTAGDDSARRPCSTATTTAFSSRTGPATRSP